MTPADLPMVTGFLEQHLAGSLFPLANIGTYGLDGTAPFAQRMWWTGGNSPGGVVALSNGGGLMPQMPDGNWSALRAALSGEEVRSLIGPTKQVRAIRSALGWDDCETRLDADEVQYGVDLDTLIIPDGPGQLVPIAKAPRDVMLDWLGAYIVEALGDTPDKAMITARADLERYQNNNSHVVLMEGEEPLAMTGFNAQLQFAVQVGGVFTPPGLRGRGHARRALALHLAKARKSGVGEAFLFTHSDAAARAYRAIGFRRIGTFSIVLFNEPQVIP